LAPPLSQPKEEHFLILLPLLHNL
jgi:hypothetical protein